ncbi:hypothetical protein IFM89_027664 [Coptis chinensis]|uniref:Uncharacterized protein n=1 Tax=Coptis chinensis TaxID=261450 RepID=A0A835J0A2_9MAGN|nr:hypothetical protein IFM89_027664 [Coptis chinensis]
MKSSALSSKTCMLVFSRVLASAGFDVVSFLFLIFDKSSGPILVIVSNSVIIASCKHMCGVTNWVCTWKMVGCSAEGDVISLRKVRQFVVTVILLDGIFNLLVPMCLKGLISVFAGQFHVVLMLTSQSGDDINLVESVDWVEISSTQLEDLPLD